MAWQLGIVLGISAAWMAAGVAVLVSAVVQGVRERSRRREAARRREQDDPLDTLILQVRLGQMARELQALEGGHSFGAAHHARAAQAAYDALLAQACRCAGLAVPGPLRTSERAARDERLREELELVSRGWSW